ncbi:MAG TPA: hypothetical protein VFO65_07120, partial [Acidimicrobiales bacterium]|nr:hypothetical protein [Acidimicrobiales bacterium]
MRFDQLLVSASPGDAITNAAFQIRQLLRLVGPSEIYAKYIHTDLLDEVLVYDQYGRSPGRSPGSDVLLFHSSIGEPIVHAFVMERPERIVLVYHNISPSRPFLPFDPGFAGLLEGGRRELAEVRDRVTCALAVSEFNARELRDLGFPD